MRGLELAEKFHDPVNQFRLISQLHSFHRRAGNFDRMLAVAQRSEAIAKEMADPIGIYAVHSLLGVSHHLIGNQAEARAHLEVALAQASASNSAKARHFGFHYERPRIVMARTLWLLGYPDQAVRFVRETVDKLAATEPVTICIALIWGACVFRWTGDLASADECIDRVIPHAERHALTPYQAVAYGLKGEVLIQRGEIETGVELLRSSLATLYAERYELYATEFNGSLAQGFAMMGRLDEALPTIDKTIAQVKRHGELSEPELQRIRGELLEKIADEQGRRTGFLPLDRASRPAIGAILAAPRVDKPRSATISTRPPRGSSRDACRDVCSFQRGIRYGRSEDRRPPIGDAALAICLRGFKTMWGALALFRAASTTVRASRAIAGIPRLIKCKTSSRNSSRPGFARVLRPRHRFSSHIVPGCSQELTPANDP
jgi:tetratricopeptide (TPR) repeat protein